ncbi:MAG: DEAD/DEAH box helicase family protein [Actinomycetota bacterium]|nr:DEAD/DEAH box helicase family protein [Actinomycetota bacterium]
MGDESAADLATPLARLKFQYPFRKYQNMMLSLVEAGPGDRRHHLVSPPGSGKTIVGLELIRRFGRPAVVFAPTTTIQEQWRAKVAMFLPGGESVDGLVSTDADDRAAINVFTYQLISVPGEADERLRELAEKLWIEELVRDDQTSDEAAAKVRLETLRTNNPEDFRREIGRRCVRLRRSSLREGAVDPTSVLHPNAISLIDDLVDAGVGTVVLDECHHLLDYWAIVLRSLIERIDEPDVVGLTATLPSPEDGNEYENYTSLLGDVDFEVPTPAVVKEGDLAPYRDLVFFVPPTSTEVEYLERVQDAFEVAIGSVTSSSSFEDWVSSLLVDTPSSEDEVDPPMISPVLFLAALRYLNSSGSLPRAEIPSGAVEEMTLQDWAALLERFALDVLKTSPEESQQDLFKELKRTLRDFGFTLTERGLRSSRSPGDLVLSFSANKDRAAIEILAAEADELRDRLRAVVVTDFERMSSGVRELEGVLERDAGSAQRVFRSLITDERTNQLDPILVTGSVLLIDADHGQDLIDRFNQELEEQGFSAACRHQETDSAQIWQVVGEGRDWSSSAYVALVTRAFERGITRCLVGTRGILGEGWDALSLNTLIDLTSVTTATSVQQLRGRTIRKDPTWPEKVAHNWDVICVAQGFERGDIDLRRFRRRHDQYWGTVSVSGTKQVLVDAFEWFAGLESGVDADSEVGRLSPEDAGRVVKGVTHVDPELAYQLATRKFSKINFGKYTNRMLRAVNTREQTRSAWGVGDEYSNFTYSASRLDPSDLRIRTVFSLSQTLKKMLRSFRASLVMSLFLVAWVMLRLGLEGVLNFRNGVILLAIGVLIAFAFNVRAAYRIARRLIFEEPPDAILLDVGRAVLQGLKDPGLVSGNLSPDFVRVVRMPDGSLEVLLDYASPEDARVFIDSFREVFDPVLDQRYLIERSDQRLPTVWLMPFWLLLRRVVRSHTHPPALHPVPTVLSVRKELAEAYARHWARFVGGGELVYTRREPGRSLLIKARVQRRPRARSLAFEVWR